MSLAPISHSEIIENSTISPTAHRLSDTIRNGEIKNRKKTENEQKSIILPK